VYCVLNTISSFKQSCLRYMSKDSKSFFMSATLFIFSLVHEIFFDMPFSIMFALSTNVGIFSHMLDTYHLVYRKNDRNSWSTIYRNPKLSWCTCDTHTHNLVSPTRISWMCSIFPSLWSHSSPFSVLFLRISPLIKWFLTTPYGSELLKGTASLVQTYHKKTTFMFSEPCIVI
jgi:hypothetical protein